MGSGTCGSKSVLTPSTSQTPAIEMPSSAMYCNTDAAWISDTKAAGLGWIFTDNEGQEITRGSSTQSHVSSTLMEEVLAVREALIHASSLNLTHICLRKNSQMLVRAITTGRRPSDLFRLLSDVDSLASTPTSTFLFCRFIFILRSSYGLANSIAKAITLFSLNRNLSVDKKTYVSYVLYISVSIN